VLGKSSQTVQEKLRCVRLSVIGVRPGAVAVAAVLRKERVKTGLNVRRASSTSSMRERGLRSQILRSLAFVPKNVFKKCKSNYSLIIGLVFFSSVVNLGSPNRTVYTVPTAFLETPVLPFFILFYKEKNILHSYSTI
jgi:hypothetical protein